MSYDYYDGSRFLELQKVRMYVRCLAARLRWFWGVGLLARDPTKVNLKIA